MVTSTFEIYNVGQVSVLRFRILGTETDENPNPLGVGVRQR